MIGHNQRNNKTHIQTDKKTHIQTDIKTHIQAYEHINRVVIVEGPE